MKRNSVSTGESKRKRLFQVNDDTYSNQSSTSLITSLFSTKSNPPKSTSFQPFSRSKSLFEPREAAAPAQSQDDMSREQERFFALISKTNPGTLQRSITLSVPASFGSTVAAPMSDDKKIQADRERSEIETFQSELVNDWHVRREVSFVSSAPIDWITPKTPAEETNSMIRFLSDSPEVGGEDDVHSLLYSWVYPPTENSPAQISTRSKLISKEEGKRNDIERAEQRFSDLKDQEWKSAFQNLYFMLRLHKCPYFYYMNGHFTVLFRVKDGDLEAMLTTASDGLRKALDRDDIPYTPIELVPKQQQNTVVASKPLENSDDEEEEDMSDTESAKDFMLATGSTNTTAQAKQYLLAFTNAHAVHCLYDFLANWVDSRTEFRLKSQPKLLSPKAFLHGSIRRVEVVHSGVVSSPSSALFTNPSTTQRHTSLMLHKLSLKGDILPDAWMSLLNRVAARLSDEDWDSNLENRIPESDVKFMASYRIDDQTRHCPLIEEPKNTAVMYVDGKRYRNASIKALRSGGFLNE